MPVLPKPEATTRAYQPLSNRRRWIAAALAVLGLASLAVPVPHFGDSPTYRLSPDRARASSDAFLRSLGANPARFHHVTYPAAHWDSADSLTAKYFLERVPPRPASALFERNRPLQLWLTRYFIPLDQEEFNVGIHPETGRITGFNHTIPETLRGADLSPDAARDIAARFAAAFGWDTAAMDLKESSAEKKVARRDHTLVWEARPGDPRNLAETRWRVELTVSGDRVTAARGYWKIPEVWERFRDRENALAITLNILKIGTLALFVVYALWLLIQGTRLGIVRWRAAISLALPAVLLFPIIPLLAIHLSAKNYRTDSPLEVFQAMTYINILISTIAGFFLTGAAAIVVTFYPNAVAALRRSSRALMAFDAVAALAAGAGMMLAVHRLQALLTGAFHQYAVLSIGAPDLVASAAPALSAIANAVRGMLVDATLLALLFLLAWQITKPWLRALLGILALCAGLPDGVRTPGEFALHYACALLAAIAAIAFCRHFARANYLAYALALWLLACYPPAAQLLAAGNPALTRQGWLLAAIFGLTLLWTVAPAFAKRQPPGPA